MLSLINYTHYSLGSGSLSVDDVINNALLQREKVAAITDINTLAAIPEFMSKCEKNGLKGVAGLKLHLAVNNQFVGDVILLAKSKKAFNSLKRIVANLAPSKSSKDNSQFTEIEVLKRYSCDTLDVVDGFAGSYLQVSQPESTNNVLFQLFPDEYRCVLSPNNDNKAARGFAASLTKSPKNLFLKTTVAAFSSVEYRSLAMQRNKEHVASNMFGEHLGDQSFLFYPLPKLVEQWSDSDGLVRWLDEKNLFVQESDYFDCSDIGVLKSTPDIPAMKSDANFGQMIDDLWSRFKHESGYSDDRLKLYKQRLDDEVSVIQSVSGFDNYFTNVYELIEYFKEQDIGISLRGSGAGSLIVYLMGVAKVDPLEYKLSFQRFLDVYRSEPPDLDIDVTDIDKCLEIMKDKFGADNVVNLTKYTTDKKWSVILPQVFDAYSQYDLKANENAIKLMKSSYERVMNAFKSLSKYEQGISFDKQLSIPRIKQAFKCDGAQILLKLALKAKELYVSKGTNRQSVLLNPKGVISNFATVNSLGDNQLLRSELTKTSVSYVGEIKYDILSLPVLATLNKIKKSAGERFNKRFHIEHPEIYELLNKGALAKFFHLNTYGGRQTVKALQPKSFQELMACIAVMRCSDMNNPDLEFSKYVSGKKNGAVYVSQLLEPILEDTYGTLIYEEQLLDICTKVSDISFLEADKLRSAIKGKKKSVIDEAKPKFVKGAMSRNNISHQEASAIYGMIEAKCETYLMGKSHCAAYAYIIAEQAALKAWSPIHYLRENLNSASNKEKIPLSQELFKEYTINLGYKISALSMASPYVGSDINSESERIISIGLSSIFSKEEVAALRNANELSKDKIIPFLKQYLEISMEKALPYILNNEDSKQIVGLAEKLSVFCLKGGLDVYIPRDVLANGKADARKSLAESLPAIALHLNTIKPQIAQLRSIKPR
ncbi:MAG: PHP domain-containing protein [Endozoicomonadaceae bacterium]|nr:PHP domain-containing protein [Endozoicomonadaceae bacterium]